MNLIEFATQMTNELIAAAKTVGIDLNTDGGKAALLVFSQFATMFFETGCLFDELNDRIEKLEAQHAARSTEGN